MPVPKKMPAKAMAHHLCSNCGRLEFNEMQRGDDKGRPLCHECHLKLYPPGRKASMQSEDLRARNNARGSVARLFATMDEVRLAYPELSQDAHGLELMLIRLGHRMLVVDRAKAAL